MKHEQILDQLLQEAQDDPNVEGVFVFGSVARGTHRENSDIDLITILGDSQPPWGMHNFPREGLKVGDLFLTYDVFVHSVDNVPYLLYPVKDARLLLDRQGKIAPLLERIAAYFFENPHIVADWDRYYAQFTAEKQQYGHEQTSIVDVWNDLEQRYSAGKIKRRFFNSFYLTNPRIFALVKRFL